jgi:hypothetical protein
MKEIQTNDAQNGSLLRQSELKGNGSWLATTWKVAAIPTEAHDGL